MTAFEIKAKERQLSTLKQNTDVELIPHREKGKARQKAADEMGTNGRYVSDAKIVTGDLSTTSECSS